MLVNKEGKAIANNSQPIKTFATEAEYTSWYSSLPNPTQDVKKFIIIKQYELAENIYIEVNTSAALQALPASKRTANCLYGVKDTNDLYRYEPTSDVFMRMGPSNVKYLHQLICTFGDESGLNFGCANFNFVTEDSTELGLAGVLAYLEEHIGEKIPVNGSYLNHTLCYFMTVSGLGQYFYGITDDGIEPVIDLMSLTGSTISDQVSRLS